MQIEIQEIRRIHQGKYLSYYEIDYLNLEGKLKTYEMVSKNHNLTKDSIGENNTAVIMLAFNKEHDKMIITQEFRMGVNQYVYGTPAGMIDAGESKTEAATRELREETGLELTRIIEILEPTFICAPVTDDIATVIICEASGEIKQSNSPDEEIHAAWYSKEQVIELLHSKELTLTGRLQAYCYGWVYGLQNTIGSK